MDSDVQLASGMYVPEGGDSNQSDIGGGGGGQDECRGFWLRRVSSGSGKTGPVETYTKGT